MPFNYDKSREYLSDYRSTSPLRTPAHNPEDVVLDFDAYTPDQSPEALIKLTHYDPAASDGRVEIYAYSQEEMFLDSTANYNAPWEDLLEQKNLRLAQGAAVGNALSDFFGGAPMIQKFLSQEHKALNNIKLSAHQWIASERPNFPLELTFIAIDRDSTPEQDAVAIMSRIYPRTNGENPEDTFTVTAPGGYRSGGRFVSDGPGEENYTYQDRRPTGTWTVEIGTYFRAPGLVLVNASLQMSPIRTTYNQPLYAKVQTQFETHKIVTEEEYRSYFLYVD